MGIFLYSICAYFLSLALSSRAAIFKRDHDCCARLDKPTLVDDLDYLEAGLTAMPMASYTLEKWNHGWIPSAVKTIVSGDGGLGFNTADFETYNVHYADAADPWVFGHHKDSNVSIDSMASQFGKVPLQMRQWVRHVIDVPGDNGWAFETDGSITFIRPVDEMLTAIIHETGHSLDLNGAYPDYPLSTSDNWYNNYAQDPNVPDGYAQTNAREDVAQNTVVAVFNENYKGGYAAIESRWSNLFHQYATLITAAQARSQNGFNLFQQSGRAVNVTHRLPPSEPVSISINARDLAATAPDVGIKGDVRIVDTSYRAASGSKGAPCGLTW